MRSARLETLGTIRLGRGAIYSHSALRAAERGIEVFRAILFL